jgi:hypothetical protein
LFGLQECQPGGKERGYNIAHIQPVILPSGMRLLLLSSDHSQDLAEQVTSGLGLLSSGHPQDLAEHITSGLGLLAHRHT